MNCAANLRLMMRNSDNHYDEYDSTAKIFVLHIFYTWHDDAYVCTHSNCK